jgi:hypothetical protein
MEPQIKIYPVENSRSGNNILASRSRSNKEFVNEIPQKFNQEYEPVNSIKSKGENNNNSYQSSQRNIVIKDQDSNDDIRIVRNSST